MDYLIVIMCVTALLVSAIASFVPTWWMLFLLIGCIFITIHIVPVFRIYASLYALILTYVLSAIPVVRLVIKMLKENEWIGDCSIFEPWKQVFIIAGISMVILHVLSVFCTYVAGFVWSRQRTLQ